MPKTEFLARQGDVLVVSETLAIEGHPVPRDNGGVVLAYGEVTGHAHQVRARGVTLFENPKTRARHLHVVRPSALSHEEHSKIVIPPGTHRILRQTQWTDENEPIAVAD